MVRIAAGALGLAAILPLLLVIMARLDRNRLAAGHDGPVKNCRKHDHAPALPNRTPKMSEQPWFQAQTNCQYCGSSRVIFRACLNDGFTDYLYKCPDCKRIWVRPTKN